MERHIAAINSFEAERAMKINRKIFERMTAVTQK